MTNNGTFLFNSEQLVILPLLGQVAQLAHSIAQCDGNGGLGLGPRKVKWISNYRKFSTDRNRREKFHRNGTESLFC